MSDAAATKPGAIVRALREARGLTRQDIADSLNLSVRVIEDVETENWANLPAPAFTRGYFRAYAKLLDMNADEVTKAFDAAVARGDVAKTDETSPFHRRQGRGVADLMQKHPGAVLTSAVGGVICAVLIVLWTVWPVAKAPAAAAALVVADAAMPKPSVATPAQTADANDSTAPAGATTKTVVAAAANTASVPALQPGPAQQHDDHGARRITNSGDDRLKFSFTQDCWVEIKDAQGGSVYSDLSKSGETLELVGHPPFHILLGNAPAVTLAFNGERIALSPHTRNNVGTLVLGQ